MTKCKKCGTLVACKKCSEEYDKLNRELEKVERNPDEVFFPSENYDKKGKWIKKHIKEEKNE